MEKFIHSISIAEFDIDKGCTLAETYPESVKFEDPDDLAHLAFPDGCHNYHEDWTYFVYRKGYTNATQAQSPRSESSSASTASNLPRRKVTILKASMVTEYRAEEGIYYGVAQFRQEMNESNKRGYKQVALLILTPYPNRLPLLQHILQHTFDKQPKCLFGYDNPNAIPQQVSDPAPNIEHTETNSITNGNNITGNNVEQPSQIVDQIYAMSQRVLMLEFLYGTLNSAFVSMYKQKLNTADFTLWQKEYSLKQLSIESESERYENLSLIQLVKLFGKKVLLIWYSIMLEQRVLLMSDKGSAASSLCLSCTVLVRPFQYALYSQVWPHVSLHQIDDIVTELYRPETKDDKKEDKKEDKAVSSGVLSEFDKKPFLVGSTNPLFATRTDLFDTVASVMSKTLNKPEDKYYFRKPKYMKLSHKDKAFIRSVIKGVEDNQTESWVREQFKKFTSDFLVKFEGGTLGKRKKVLFDKFGSSYIYKKYREEYKNRVGSSLDLKLSRRPSFHDLASKNIIAEPIPEDKEKEKKKKVVVKNFEKALKHIKQNLEAEKKEEASKQIKTSPRDQPQDKTSPRQQDTTTASSYIENNPNPFDKKAQSDKKAEQPVSPTTGSTLKPESARSGQVTPKSLSGQVTPKSLSGQVTPRSVSGDEAPEYIALPEEDFSDEDEEDTNNNDKKDRRKHFKGLRKYLKAIAHKKSPRREKDTTTPATNSNIQSESASQTPHAQTVASPASVESTEYNDSSGTTSPDKPKWQQAKSAWASKKTAKSTAEIKKPPQRLGHKKQTSADYDRVDLLITPAALVTTPQASAGIKDAQIRKLAPKPKEDAADSSHKKRRAAKSHSRSKSVQLNGASDKDSDMTTSSSGEFRRLKDGPDSTGPSSSSSRADSPSKQSTKRLSWNHAEPTHIVVTNPFLQSQSTTKRDTDTS